MRRFAIVLALIACASSCSDGGERSSATVDAGSAAADAGPPLDSGVADAEPPLVIDPALNPVVCATEPCVVEITAKAGRHACARRSDGSVGCWGEGAAGQLGLDPSNVPDAGAAFGTRPMVVTGLPSSVGIAVGGRGYVAAGTGPGSIGMNGNSCARAADGAVHCWGETTAMFQGVSRTSTWVPSKMPFPPAASIELGNGILCVTDGNGVPICSGEDEAGDGLVPSTSTESKAPRAVSGVTGCLEMVGSARNVFCRDASGAVHAWGFGRSLFPNELQSDVEPSLLGRLSSLTRAPVAPIPTLTYVSRMSASWSTACAVVNGDVRCWGRSDEGQLGTGVRTYEAEPYTVTAIERDYTKQVATGSGTTCAVSGAGRVYCWGDNAFGQLGRADVLDATTPVAIEDVPEMVQVAVMEATVCALTRDGVIWCWGANQQGQLGRGTRDSEPHPKAEPVGWGP